MNKNQQRHKRKESFSILLLSNTGKSNRQFHLSFNALRILLATLVLICIAFICLLCQYVYGRSRQSYNQEKLNSQEQLVKQLEMENQTLSEEKTDLTEELEVYRQAEAEAAAAADTSSITLPSHYPCSGTNFLATTFSEDHPCLTMRAMKKCKVVAAGAGKVVTVGATDTYSVLIEIMHESGCRTRYMSHKTADIRTKPGKKVKEGDVLFTITRDETMVDYQVLINETPLDPLTILDAKG